MNGYPGVYGYSGSPYTKVKTEPNLLDVHNKAMKDTEVQKIQAQAELEKAKTEYLQLQIGVGDPKRIEPLLAVQKSPVSKIGLGIILIGLYFLIKKKGKAL